MHRIELRSAKFNVTFCPADPSVRRAFRFIQCRKSAKNCARKPASANRKDVGTHETQNVLTSQVHCRLSGNRRGNPHESTGRSGTGEDDEKDLYHFAHQRHAFGLHRHGSILGLHAVHTQQRRDPGRVLATGEPDRHAKEGARRRWSRPNSRRGRLQHGDCVRRRQPRDRRRAANYVPDGLRRHHVR